MFREIPTISIGVELRQNIAHTKLMSNSWVMIESTIVDGFFGSNQG